MPNIKELAEILHEHFCSRDHVEQCTWDYEDGYVGKLWEQPAHKKWLKIAIKVHKRIDLSLKDIIKCLKFSTKIKKACWIRER